MFLCIGGKDHNMMPTGRRYQMWQSNRTETEAPEGAPWFETYRCYMCGHEEDRPIGSLKSNWGG